MESKSIYEDSYEELTRIYRAMTAESFTIDTSKLDGNTKNLLLRSIRDVVAKRKKDIEKVILGVQ